MDPILAAVVKGLAVSSGLAAAAYGAGIAGRRAPAAMRPWAGALAVALAYFGSAVVTDGWPVFPGIKDTHWLAWFALLGGGLGAAEPAYGTRRWWIGVVALSAAALAVATLWRSMAGPWSAGTSAVHATALLAGTLLLWAPVRSAPAGDLRPAVAVTITAGGSAMALGLAHSQFLAQLAASVAVAGGIGGALGWWQSRWAPGRSLAAPAALLLAGLLSSGAHFADLWWPAAFVLAATPVAAALGTRIAARLPVGPPWIAPAVAAAACVGLGVGLTLAGLPAPPDYGEYGG